MARPRQHPDQMALPLGYAVWDRQSLASATALLPELTEVLASQAPLSHLLATVCERSAWVFGARRSSIFLLDDGVLAPRMSRRADGGRDPQAWSHFLSAKAAPSLVRAAVTTGRPQLAAPLRADPEDAWWAETFNVGSVLAVPLGVPGRVVGALALDSADPHGFDRAMAERVGVVAAPLGSVVEWGLRTDRQEIELAGARAVRELLEGAAAVSRSRDAAALIGRVMGRALGAERTVVLYLAAPGDSGVEAVSVDLPPEIERALGDLLADRNLGEWRNRPHRESRQAAFVEHVDAATASPGGLAETLELQAVASVPLLAGNELIGRVLCGQVSGPRHWRAVDRHVAGQLALESGLVMDGARLREAEAAHRFRLAHEATHDALTGLPNRTALTRRLEEAVQTASREQCPETVLLIDLDRFKEVNDTLGHHHGDALLAQVAHRLQSALHRDGVLCRMGGDEFAVVLEPGHGWEEGELVAARIVAALDAPFDLQGSVIRVAGSIGVASFPEHAPDPDLLIQRADAAMYAAKAAKLPWLVYRAGSDLCLPRRTELAGGLARAIGEHELVLHYQPKVDLASGAAVGFEALVRWRHPRLGLLGPGEFLPMVTATGQMSALSTWVIEGALADCGSWWRTGRQLPVSVNVSALDLADPGFPARVELALARAELPGAALMLELTEHTQLSHPGLAADVVAALRILGVRLSVDDFGTGFSSLAYLELLPVDEIKIDRSFLSPGLSPKRSAVVRAVLGLGRDLGLEVVAEGVETAEMAEWLRDLGCRVAQGYHFAAPLPVELLGAWLGEHSYRTAS